MTLVILSDNVSEMGMNLLNNAHKNMVDNFWSIKWIFHEIEDIKIRMQGQERTEGGDGTIRIRKLDVRVTKIEKRVERMESSLHSSTNQRLDVGGKQ